MDRPFSEVHELYRILYLRAEAQARAEKEKQEKEELERKKQQERERPKGIPPSYYHRKPTDDKNQPNNIDIPTPSPLEAEALEEALEELAEGGMV